MAPRVHRVETGAQLRKWRTARGWSQYQAAMWYGCREETWKKYELRPLISLQLRQRVAEIIWQERLLKMATPRPVSGR